MKAAVLFCALLAGCSVHVHGEGGGRTLAVLLGLSILAGGAFEAERAGHEVANAAPPLAPQRRVSEQDCTRPIDHSLGNLRCK